MYFNCEDIEMMETEDITTDSNDRNVRNDSTGSQSTPFNTNNGLHLIDMNIYFNYLNDLYLYNYRVF